MSTESSFAETRPQPRVFRPSPYSVGHRAAVGAPEALDDASWFRQDPPRRSFAQLLGLTTLGALLPGAGLIAAGRRSIGTLILSTFCWSLVAAGVAVALGMHERLAVRPNALRLIAGALIAAGFAWALVIAVSHLSLRRGPLRVWQHVVSLVLVVALMSMALLTTATGAQIGLAQAGLINSVFGGEGRAALALKGGATRVNVLLLGSDAGDGRVGVRPDTLIVASINTRTGDTVLFTLPRNLQKVPFPAGTPGARAWPNGFDCDDCLLNAVWKWGEENAALFPGDPSPGLTATRHAVSAALGLRVDYYALVNLDGFKDVVDAMGGVTLNVPRPLPIGGGTNALTGRKNPVRGYIPAGVQRLNGDQALWYARSREGSDDYDRMKRQRCFLNAVVEQADPASLARSFPRLARAAKENVHTDIAQAELDDWVELAGRVQKAQVRSLPFTNEVITPANPDFSAIRALVRQGLRDPGAAADVPPRPRAAEPRVGTPPSEVRVRVLNGTDVPGLGARTAAELRSQGFVVEAVADAGKRYPVSVVRHDPAYDGSARTVSVAAGGARRVPVTDLGGTVTFIVGADFSAVRPVKGASAPAPQAPAEASPSAAAGAAETCA